MSKKTKDYEEGHLEDLRDPVEAAAYLEAHLADGEPDAEELFLLALRDVTRAQGFSAVAEEAGLGRESLYKALSESGNPRLSTLRTLLNALGLRLSVVQQEEAA